MEVEFVMLEMYLQIVSTPAEYPEVVVVVELEYVWPIGPGTVVVVKSTAVVMVRVTLSVLVPDMDEAGKTTYWSTPQYTVVELAGRV